jgi:hypothetical protein
MASTTSASRTRRPTKKAAEKATTIRVWEDDPLSEGAVPIERPVPKFPKGKLRVAIDVTQPPPGRYEPGTPEFRYWTAADALTRALAFWTPILPKGTSWQIGRELPVKLDAGDRLNALYNRQNLVFFHAAVKGQTVFTGESPDVVIHELGHAMLDAIRPQLWNALSGEVAAFHESFGDMAALLTALQLPSVQTAILAETGGVLNRSTRFSRLSEQLGWGVRQRQPCAVEPDCLRNAVNCFFYQPAEKIPIIGPAAILSSEPHSYSRVFTGAFWVTLTGMVVTLNRNPDRATLEQASADAARLLVAAVVAAPVVPAYMSQVAAHFLAADLELFGGRYQDAIRNGFVGKGVLAASAVSGGGAAALDIAAAAIARPPRRLGPDLPEVTLAGFDFGLGDRPVRVQAAGEAPRLAVAASAEDGGPAQAASPEDAARGFLRELFVRNRITVPGTDPGDRIHTHDVVEDGDALRIVRRLVDEAPVSLGE